MFDTTAKCRLRIAETGQFHGHKREPFFISFLRRFPPPHHHFVRYDVGFVTFHFSTFRRAFVFPLQKKKTICGECMYELYGNEGEEEKGEGGTLKIVRILVST